MQKLQQAEALWVACEQALYSSQLREDYSTSGERIGA